MVKKQRQIEYLPQLPEQQIIQIVVAKFLRLDQENSCLWPKTEGFVYIKYSSERLLIWLLTHSKNKFSSYKVNQKLLACSFWGQF